LKTATSRLIFTHEVDRRTSTRFRRTLDLFEIGLDVLSRLQPLSAAQQWERLLVSTHPDKELRMPHLSVGLVLLDSSSSLEVEDRLVSVSFSLRVLTQKDESFTVEGRPEKRREGRFA